MEWIIYATAAAFVIVGIGVSIWSLKQKDKDDE